MTNFTTGTSICCGGNPDVSIPKVNGFFDGNFSYRVLELVEDDTLSLSFVVCKMTGLDDDITLESGRFALGGDRPKHTDLLVM